jgi:hypothetical protein
VIGGVHQNPDEEKNPQGFFDIGKVCQDLEEEKNSAGILRTEHTTDL